MSSLRDQYDRVALPTGLPFNQNMTLNGDGTTVDMATDYSGVSGPVRFYIQPPASRDLVINTITLLVSDKGAPDIDGWGSIGTSLSVGVRLFFENPNGIIYDDAYLNSNRDLSRGAGGFQLLEFGNIRVIRYSRQYVPFGGFLELRSDQPEDKFGVELHDDFSTLDEMSASVNAATFLAQV